MTYAQATSAGLFLLKFCGIFAIGQYEHRGDLRHDRSARTQWNS